MKQGKQWTAVEKVRFGDKGDLGFSFGSDIYHLHGHGQVVD